MTLYFYVPIYTNRLLTPTIYFISDTNRFLKKPLAISYKNVFR